jgi:hypothetical protein
MHNPVRHLLHPHSSQKTIQGNRGTMCKTKNNVHFRIAPAQKNEKEKKRKRGRKKKTKGTRKNTET